jgi:hypothetical protein
MQFQDNVFILLAYARISYRMLCLCCGLDQTVTGTLTLCSLLSSCSSFRDSTCADHDPLGHTENQDDSSDLNGIDKIFEGIQPASYLWLVFSLFAACLAVHLQLLLLHDCQTTVFSISETQRRNPLL